MTGAAHAGGSALTARRDVAREHAGGRRPGRILRLEQNDTVEIVVHSSAVTFSGKTSSAAGAAEAITRVAAVAAGGVTAGATMSADADAPRAAATALTTRDLVRREGQGDRVLERSATAVKDAAPLGDTRNAADAARAARGGTACTTRVVEDAVTPRAADSLATDTT